MRTRRRRCELLAECRDCDWSARNEGGMDDRKTSRKARSHAQGTGHSVGLEIEETVMYEGASG